MKASRHARCPLPACHRSQKCLHAVETDCCHRLFMEQDEFYTALADKINRIRKELIAKRPKGVKVKVAKPGSKLFERRHKLLYDALRARDQATTAEERAWLASLKPGSEKPADTPGDV